MDGKQEIIPTRGEKPVALPQPKSKPEQPQDMSHLELYGLGEKREGAFTRHTTAKKALDDAVSADLSSLKALLTPPISHTTETTSTVEEPHPKLSDTLERIDKTSGERVYGETQRYEAARSTLTRSDSFVGDLQTGILDVSAQISDIASQITPLEEQIAHKRDELRVLEKRNIAARALSFRVRADLSAEIQGLETQRNALSSQQNQLELQVRKAQETIQTLEKSREQSVITISEGVIAGVIEKYESFQETLLGDSEMKRELNELLIQAELMPKLEELKATYDIPQEKIDEYLELIRGQLNEGVQIKADDLPETTQRIETRNQQVLDLYKEPKWGYSLSQLQYSVGLNEADRYAPSANAGYNQILEMLIRNEECELLQRFAGEIQTADINPKIRDAVLQAINDRLTPKKDSGMGSFEGYGYTEPSKPDELDIYQIDDKAFTKHFMSQFAIQRWDTVKTYPGTEALFGEEGFAKLEQKIQKKTIDTLLITPEHTNEAIELGYRLLLFKNAEAAPFVIMNCWREPGYSGEQPFLSIHDDPRDTAVYKYITSLSPEELHKLEQMNVPGVMEVINAVKTNPDTFLYDQMDNPDYERFIETYAKKYDMRVRDVEYLIERSQDLNSFQDRLDAVAQETGISVDIVNWGNRRIPNPVNQTLERGLVRLSLHLMSEGDEAKQFFVMGVLKRTVGDLGADGYTAIGNILRTTKSPRLQGELLEMVIRRYKDINAAITVLQSYESLPPNLQQEVKNIGPKLLRRFLEKDEALSTENLQMFGQVLGRTPEELKGATDFIKGLKDAVPYGGAVINYDDDKLDLYIELAKHPGLSAFIQELVPLGYQFTIDHTHVLPGMMQNRDSILAAIQEIKTFDQNFKYVLPYEFEFDPQSREAKQVYITDPYEMFVRQFFPQSYEELFNKLYQLQQEHGSFRREYSDGLLRTLRLRDNLLSTEQKKNIDETTYSAFHSALQRLVESTSNRDSKLHEFKYFYLSSNTLHLLARRPELSELVFAFPEHGRLLMERDMTETLGFIFKNDNALLQDVSDLKYLNRFAELFGSDINYFINQYLEGIQKGEINRDNREQFIEKYRAFAQTHTTFSSDRMVRHQTAAESPFGKALVDLVPDEIERNKIIFDYACFTERLETNKINLVIQRVREGINGVDLRQTFEYLRWLPEAEITSQDSLDSLKSKYLASQERLKVGFNKIFPNSQEILSSSQNYENLKKKLDEICERFRLKTRQVTISGVQVNLPVDFIKEFNALRRESPDAQFIPELAGYLIDQASRLSTAYTIEDIMFSQIGETEDQTGRRRGRYTAEQLLQVMENNIEASLFTWTTAISYQREEPESPLFIIANERTGPADLAAEYLPTEFAERFKIQQVVDYDSLFQWFRQNEALVDGLYEKFIQGESVKDAIPQEILSILGIDSHTIIPIYRLKVPSSLNGATDEPEGINTVLSFLKLTSILDGRTLFMDESTRSAPRSIECLYNFLNRRQQALGGVQIRLFGKIKGVQGQNGTPLQEVNPATSQLEIAFVDPWHSQVKSVTDDSVGFVPEVQGKGVVEVVRPSYTSVSPYGISTVQDFWKQLIANEVSLRYEGFEESGGAKKRREEFKPAPKEGEEILTQDELQRMAFERPYKSLVLDLDGTVGSKGKYNPQVLERIKELSGGEIDVVIGTSRSLIDHSEYDGSVASFIEQLGELSDTQKAHIHLATEDGAVISPISDLETALEQHPLSDEIAGAVSSILTTLPASIRMFGEQGTLVLRGFEQEGKETVIDTIRTQIEKLGLPLKVGSDSKHSIHIRLASSSKRNILNWLEARGININDIAKIGDSPDGNDRAMFWGRGSFNVGESRTGTLWTIHQNEHEGGPKETELLLQKLQFAK